MWYIDCRNEPKPSKTSFCLNAKLKKIFERLFKIKALKI